MADGLSGLICGGLVIGLMELKMTDMKPCPFCGKHPYMDGDDTLYPTGGWLRLEDGLIVYENCWDIHVRKLETPEKYGVDFGNVYTMHCPEVYGGCGAQISGNSNQDAIDKWNHRV